MEEHEDEDEISTPTNFTWDDFFETWVPASHEWGSVERKVYLKYLNEITRGRPSIVVQMEKQQRDYRTLLFQTLKRVQFT
jgi:hypothetical protein